LTIQELGLGSRGWAGILAGRVFGAIVVFGLRTAVAVILKAASEKMEGEAPELLRKTGKSAFTRFNLLE